jgi:hypothetical protein
VRPIFILGLALFACSGETGTADAPDEAAVTPADSAPPELLQYVDTADLPDMPEFPSGRAGMLQVVSAGTQDLAGSVEATAGLCQNPSMLMLGAPSDGDSWGYIVLLQVPPEGSREGIYPVAHADRGFPVPPASQVGVQQVTAAGGDAYQGLQGFAEVTEFSETITGRFQMTVRHIVSEEMVQLAGSFENLPIHDLPANECLPAAAFN